MEVSEYELKSRLKRYDIADLLKFPQEGFDTKTCFHFEGVDLSYRELRRSSRALGAGLLSRGLQYQERVTTLLPNCLEIWQLYFATAAARGIFMPLNRDLAPSEIAYMLNHASPRFIFTSAALLPKLEEALASLGNEPTVIMIDEAKPHGQRVDFLEAADVASLPATDPEDVVIISYTSGSTSNPKAMAFSHRVELDGAKLYEDAWGITSKDKVLIAMSLGWTFGVNPGSFPELRAGGSILLLEKFNPVKVLEAIENHRITVMKGVPTMYAMMLAHVEETGKEYDLSSLRVALCAGADLPLTLAQKFKQRFGLQLTNFLGMSEVKLVASPRYENGFLAPDGSVGTPPPGMEVRFVDENMQDVPTGETGEFLVRSVAWMTGYFGDPQKTAACNLDGWYVSGDLGRRDEDGYIFYVGRLREQIIRGGAKIAPAEVEEVLMSRPDITLCAVIGVPDEMYGEAVKAFVVTKDPGPETETLRTYCAERLANFKVPTIFEFVPDLPIGPTGKVQKKLLK
ncbi:AMP-dependent synthetase and ligase [Rhizobium leguminosarum bv. trifolii]|uniref:class I adenylate-forming enzyme family protein n=1 Tax=Rhizobium leguminosarum TaxID=384 RepID=UPI000E2FF128|nr:class I adenylate-forming enzyme family protein [Rhizobium leguminosarum]RFB87071.1 AMP-dependent synthetase and ligase [Rhizobium leguminosarum bv. trifolii]